MHKTRIIVVLLIAILLVLGACAPELPLGPKPVPPPEPRLPGVGEMVDIGKGAFITVESFEKRGSLGYITVLVDNSRGSEDIRVDFQMSFLVEDKEGNTAVINMDAERDYPVPQGAVPAGDKLRGTLVYQLAPLGEGLTLYYSHDISQGYIKIALE